MLSGFDTVEYLGKEFVGVTGTGLKWNQLGDTDYLPFQGFGGAHILSASLG